MCRFKPNGAILRLLRKSPLPNLLGKHTYLSESVKCSLIGSAKSISFYLAAAAELYFEVPTVKALDESD